MAHSVWYMAMMGDGVWPSSRFMTSSSRQEEMSDDRPLLRVTELPTNHRQDERLLFFQMIILGNPGDDHLAEQMPLGTGDDHGPADLLRQAALDVFQQFRQSAVRELATPERPGHLATGRSCRYPPCPRGT